MNESIHIKNAAELEHEATLLIGLFYFEKNNYDFVASRKEIEGTGFHMVKHIETEPSHMLMFNGVETATQPILKFDIYVEWPGIFIGSEGTNIDALSKYLASNFSSDYAEGITVRLRVKEVDLSGLFFYEKMYFGDKP